MELCNLYISPCSDKFSWVDTEGLTGAYQLLLFSGPLLSLDSDAVVLYMDITVLEENAAFTFRITSTLETETTYQSETLIANCQTTRCQNPKDDIFNNPRSKNLGTNSPWTILR
jgi:hypothetical protein